MKKTSHLVSKNIWAITLLMFYLNLGLAQSYQDSVFTNSFKRNGNGWNAGDGTISIPLPDGRTLWLFGDSHVNQAVINNELPCIFNTRNAAMVQEGSNFSTYYNESGADIYDRQFINMPGDTDKTYWPAGGFVYDNNVYSFWEKYTITAATDIVFEGMVIAQISLPSIEVISVTPLSDTSLEFGMAISTDLNTGYHYIYGRINEGIFRQAYVARCPIGQIFSDWEFYSGNDIWLGDISSIAPILDNVSNSFSVFKCDNKYYLLTQERGFLQCGAGRDIYLYESDYPEGPFTNQTIVYTMEDQFNNEYPITYNAQAHPQFIENNELLVSYNLNKTCPNPCINANTFNADMYRPKFARITLSENCQINVATDDAVKKNHPELYPNPSSTEFTLQLNENNSFSLAQIYSLEGQLINQINITSTTQIINIEKFKSGVFLLRLIGHNKTLWQSKLIKI